MKLNFLVLGIASLVPMIMGFIYYNPKIFGNAWKEACGLSDEKMKDANMGLIFGVSFLMSFLLSVAVNFMVIHQWHLQSIFLNEPGFQEGTGDAKVLFDNLMSKYGTNFRTFKHGAFHGIIGGLFFALPILVTNALFERKSFKYMLINIGYWVITLALMGGIICQYA